MRSRFVFLSLVGMATLALAATQNPTLLRKQLKENETDAYIVSMTGDQNIESPMGPMELAFKGGYDWTFKTKTVDTAKKQADVEMLVSNFKFEMSGPMAEMMPGNDQAPKDVTTTGKMDERYRLTDAKSPGMDMRMMMALGASAGLTPLIELPEAPVKPGDTWSVAVPKTPMLGNQEVKLKAIFKGEGTVDKLTGNQIELSGTIPLDIDLSKVMDELAKSGNDPSGGAAQGMKMTMKGALSLNIVGILDKATGKILVSTMTVGNDTTLTLVDMGMSLPGKGKLTMKMLAK